MAFLRRLAFLLVALVCFTSGNYTLRAGEPTPRAVVMLAAETEAEHRVDTTAIQRTVARKRAGDPLRTIRHHHHVAREVGRMPTPRGPPAPHVEPRGPPVVA